MANELIPLGVRIALRNAVGGWGPHSVREIHDLFNSWGFLELPAVRGRRDRIVTPQEAARLLDALPARDRALWATALCAGLRRGELMALRWQDIDLDQGVIRVECSWDMREGPVEPKSKAGRRDVPIARVLREHLIAHKLLRSRSIGGLSP